MQNKVFIKSCRFDKIIADSNKKFPIDFTDFFLLNKSQKYFLYLFLTLDLSQLRLIHLPCVCPLLPWLLLKSFENL